MARVEPISYPQFDPSFSFPPGSSIFTVGSCFARNIEHHLVSFGFDVPSYRYFGPSHMINKYHPFSILQELRWALGLEKPLTFAERAVKVADSGWLDLHIHCDGPFSRADCLKAMDASKRLFSEVKTCSVFVVTLGLVEVWYDTEHNVYLNESLNFERLFREDEKLKKYFADRLRFRVLNFNEAYFATHEIFSLIKEHAPKDAKAILTVSPVSLNATFTGKDVLTANMYSKSMLRTVAEEICSNFDFVDYFPSYESIALSPRREVYEVDGQHVKDHAVSFNVNRMVEAYVRGAEAPAAAEG